MPKYRPPWRRAAFMDICIDDWEGPVSEQDRAFMINFSVILALLVGIAILFFVMATLISGLMQPDRAQDPVAARAVEDRLQPEGGVHVGEVAEVEPEDDEVDVADVGREVYEGTCMACHATGVQDAPRTDDEDVWKTLLDERGFSGLLENSIEGIGAMPARGGNPALSDEEMEKALVHMLEESGVDVDEHR